MAKHASKPVSPPVGQEIQTENQEEKGNEGSADAREARLGEHLFPPA
jgi:hypothetical protein